MIQNRTSILDECPPLGNKEVRQNSDGLKPSPSITYPQAQVIRIWVIWGLACRCSINTLQEDNYNSVRVVKFKRTTQTVLRAISKLISLERIHFNIKNSRPQSSLSFLDKCDESRMFLRAGVLVFFQMIFSWKRDRKISRGHKLQTWFEPKLNFLTE